MKKGFVFLTIVLAGLLGVYILGCSQRIEKFGEALEETASKTSIGVVLYNPQSYIDKDIVVEGIIASECPTGGWINVRDASGSTIYVEMHGASFAPIPQRVGKSVVVKGTVYQTEGTNKETKLLGKGLIIK